MCVVFRSGSSEIGPYRPPVSARNCFGDWSGQRVAEVRGALRFDLLDLDQEPASGMLSQLPFEQLRARKFHGFFLLCEPFGSHMSCDQVQLPLGVIQVVRASLPSILQALDGGSSGRRIERRAFRNLQDRVAGRFLQSRLEGGPIDDRELDPVASLRRSLAPSNAPSASDRCFVADSSVVLSAANCSSSLTCSFVARFELQLAARIRTRIGKYPARSVRP